MVILEQGCPGTGNRGSGKLSPGRESVVSTPRRTYSNTSSAVADEQNNKRALSTSQWGTNRQGSQDVQDFQAFYQENFGLIYRFIYSRIGNHEDTEDLTSQTFIKAVRSMDPERGPHSMQKWLYRVAHTTVADYWRAYYRVSVSSLDELLDAGWEGPVEEEPIVASKTPADKVQRILAALLPHYREVLTCRFLLNLSIKETAARMGLTEANVKVLQFRALRSAKILENDILGTG